MQDHLWIAAAGQQTSSSSLRRFTDWTSMHYSVSILQKHNFTCGADEIHLLLSHVQVRSGHQVQPTNQHQKRTRRKGRGYSQEHESLLSDVNSRNTHTQFFGRFWKVCMRFTECSRKFSEGTWRFSKGGRGFQEVFRNFQKVFKRFPHS